MCRFEPRDTPWLQALGKSYANSPEGCTVCAVAPVASAHTRTETSTSASAAQHLATLSLLGSILLVYVLICACPSTLKTCNIPEIH